MGALLNGRRQRCRKATGTDQPKTETTRRSEERKRFRRLFPHSGGAGLAPLPAAPPRSFERVVHGGQGDLQLLRQGQRALPALHLLPEIRRLLVAELECPAALLRRT